MTVSVPAPRTMARHHRDVANLLEASWSKAHDMALELASRGYPTGTLGDGGSRGAATATSTERAALGPIGADTDTDIDLDDRWIDVDVRLVKLARLYRATGLQLQQLIGDLLAHGSTDDELAAGSGPCACCDHTCRPDLKLNDRRRSGLCPRCWASWQLWKKTNKGGRGAFIAWRRRNLGIVTATKPPAGERDGLVAGEPYHAEAG